MTRRIDNIKLLHLIKFLSSLYFYHQVVTLYLQARGLNYLQINSLWGIIVGVQALAEVPTGIIADRISRKFSIAIALLLQFVGEYIFIYANNYFLFICTCVIAGVGFSFLSGCFEAMIYDSLKAVGKENQMQKTTGLNSSFGLAATLAGSIIGGFITANLLLPSFVQAIILTAFFVFLSFLASLLLKEPALECNHPKENSLILLKDGLHLIRTNRSFQRIILLSLLTTPFINYLLNFYPPYFVESGVNRYFLGVTLAAGSLLGVFTSKYAYLLEKIFGVQKGILLAVLLPGLLYFLLALISHPILSMIFVILAFSSMHIQKPIFWDYLNRHIESKNRATVLSLINVISGFYVAVMGLFIGLAADMSLSYAFIFMGALITIGAFLVKIDDSHIRLETENTNSERL